MVDDYLTDDGKTLDEEARASMIALIVWPPVCGLMGALAFLLLRAVGLV